jgi:hypothetical protein
MKKNLCLIVAIIIILAVCMLPSLADHMRYPGATITVIHCGYNRDWDPDPGMPIGVVEIRTSGSYQHYAWTAIRIGANSDWDEDWGDKSYTSHSYVEILAYGYPEGLETDYDAFYY